jgi:hypothetical protein
MKLCTIDSCEERNVARGYCSFHYKRWQINGNPRPDIPKKPHNARKVNEGLICMSEGCERNAERAQLCMAHYQRLQKYGDTLPDKPIVVRKGWYLHKTGYKVIPAQGHPNANAAGSIMEHVKIMSDTIGRPLAKEETVHHKNGIRDDNRVENLELWASNHPKGSRVRDLVVYANEIINKYGKEPERYA